MKFHSASGILLIVLGLHYISPQTIAAHDGWVEISPAIVEKNQIGKHYVDSRQPFQ